MFVLYCEHCNSKIKTNTRKGKLKFELTWTFILQKIRHFAFMLNLTLLSGMYRQIWEISVQDIKKKGDYVSQKEWQHTAAHIIRYTKTGVCTYAFKHVYVYWTIIAYIYYQCHTLGKIFFIIMEVRDKKRVFIVTSCTFTHIKFYQYTAH